MEELTRGKSRVVVVVAVRKQGVQCRGGGCKERLCRVVFTSSSPCLDLVG